MERTRRAVPVEVREAAERLDAWRQGNSRRRRIPDEIWLEATALAHRYGVGLVAATLRLKRCSLRERVGDNAAVPASFVEVQSHPRAADKIDAVVELTLPTGHRMEIRTGAPMDFGRLIRSFVHDANPCCK